MKATVQHKVCFFNDADISTTFGFTTTTSTFKKNARSAPLLAKTQNIVNRPSSADLIRCCRAPSLVENMLIAGVRQTRTSFALKKKRLLKTSYRWKFLMLLDSKDTYRKRLRSNENWLLFIFSLLFTRKCFLEICLKIR